MNNSFNIQRIGDHSYTINFDDPNSKSVIINISKDDTENNEFFYNLVTNVANKLFRNAKDHKDFNELISIGNKSWSIKTIDKSKSILSHITSLIHKQGNDDIVRLNIERADTLSPATDDTTDDDLLASPDNATVDEFNLEKALEQNVRDCAEHPGMLPCSQKELHSGIRGKFGVTEYSLENDLETSFFDNPFNILSTLAFQRYEKEFSGHDDFKAEDCSYCLTLENNELKLVIKSEKINKNYELHRETSQYYRQLLISEYGSQKLAYAEKICRIDLGQIIKEGVALTPEHVYRLTLALNNIETEDLKSFLQKIPNFKIALLGSLEAKGQNAPLWDVLNNIQDSPFTKTELRGILNLLKQGDKNITPHQLLEWIDQLEGKTSLKQLTPDFFDLLTQVFFPSAQDYQKLFTGRKIYYPMGPVYATAQKGKLKPWIDQQELLQTFPIIQNTQNWDLYFEKLSFVICKKHLFREHPEKGYVTGVLIPGPLGENGEKRWYKVSQAVDNGYGTLCYTLDPACNDPSLPQIKVFRSTSSDPYAIAGTKTIRTDVNPLGLPGYEGKGRADYYEDSDLKSGTIPVWVGYTYAASQKLVNEEIENPAQLQSVFHTLAAATKELHHCETKKIENLSLKEIVQKHNGIINNLYLRGYISETLFRTLRDEYLQIPEQQRKDPEFYEHQKNDAEFLINSIIAFQYKLEEFHPTLQVQMKTELDHLIQDLDHHLLLSKSQIERFDHLNQMHDKIFNNLGSIEKSCQEAIKNNDFKEVNKLCKRWVRELEKYAKSIGEDLKSKETKDIAFTGHSLGGGLSQIYTVHHFMEKGRMPCPGRKCLTYEFDGTGVSKEDNEKYKQFLVEHSEMLKDCNVGFEVYHQHEASDPVSHIGTHLGSATNLKDAAEVLMNLSFRAAVFKRNPDTKHPTLANAKTIHATQFLEGKEGQDYNKQDIDPYMLGLMESYETMTDFSEEEIRQKGKKLRSEVWRFPFPLSPHIEEKIRSHPALFQLADKVLSNWIEHDPQIINYLDPYGNFCADENGLASQKIDFYPSSVPFTPKDRLMEYISERNDVNLYVGSDMKLLMKKMFHVSDEEIEAKTMEFEQKLAKNHEKIIALGGNELSIRIPSGQVNAMLLTPELFMKKLSDVGIKQLNVRIGDQISNVFFFDIKNPAQRELLIALKDLNLEQFGWSTASLAEGLIFGDSKFLNQVKNLEDIHILSEEKPLSEGSKNGVLICSGNLSRYEMHASEAVSLLLKGNNVMLFNPPGYGKSKGSPNPISMKEACIAAYDTFARQKKLKEENVLIKSVCMSEEYVSELAKLHPKASVWIDQTSTAFASLIEIAPESKEHPLSSLILQCCHPAFDIAKNLAHHTGWKCLTYDAENEMIPPSHILRNFDGLDESKPTQVIQLTNSNANLQKVDQFLYQSGFFKPMFTSEQIMQSPAPASLDLDEIGEFFTEEMIEEDQILQEKSKQM